MTKKDLRQMKKARLKKDDIKKAAKKAKLGADVENVDDGDIKSVEDTIKKYENKSEDELMGDLESMVQKGKQDGSFSNEMLEAFIKNVSPMMDKEQRKRLMGISEMIKKK